MWGGETAFIELGYFDRDMSLSGTGGFALWFFGLGVTGWNPVLGVLGWVDEANLFKNRHGVRFMFHV